MAGPTAAPAAPTEVGLGQEVRTFESAADRILLGDLEIRAKFARNIMLLFAAANAFVLVGLGVVFWQDCVQLAAGKIAARERIIDAHVIMALLGATTVQLGTVVFTITRAIFPGPPSPSND